ncbi:MAG: DUF559 domain-containing protein [Solirubrobacterales bacterium]|nr:DUF559 domain-containing protein [Solirubrobacterales bacterium]
MTDAALRARAARQHGVLTVAQLRSLGLGARAIRSRAATGRLRRMHRGIYAVIPPDQRAQWSAAVLACGEGAVLSHRSAASLHGLLRERSDVHVTVPRGRARPRAGLVVHLGSLDPDDVDQQDGIACTSVARTLLDVAASVSAAELRRAVARSEELRTFDLTAIRRVLARSRGVPGRRVLATLLADYEEPADLRSPAEAALLAALRRTNLPSPAANVWLALPEGGGYRPDLLWRDARLIVEIDGRTYHARRAAFEHDRRRDRRLRALGYDTVRYSAREVSRDPAGTVREIASFLTATQRHP